MNIKLALPPKRIAFAIMVPFAFALFPHLSSSGPIPSPASASLTIILIEVITLWPLVHTKRIPFVSPFLILIAWLLMSQAFLQLSSFDALFFAIYLAEYYLGLVLLIVLVTSILKNHFFKLIQDDLWFVPKAIKNTLRKIQKIGSLYPGRYFLLAGFALVSFLLSQTLSEAIILLGLLWWKVNDNSEQVIHKVPSPVIGVIGIVSVYVLLNRLRYPYLPILEAFLPILEAFLILGLLWWVLKDNFEQVAHKVVSFVIEVIGILTGYSVLDLLLYSLLRDTLVYNHDYYNEWFFPVLTTFIFFGPPILFASRFRVLPRLPKVLQTVIIGIISGSLLVSLLAYPVYTLVYIRFIPEIAREVFTFNHPHELVLRTSGIISIVLIFITGPIAVMWVKPSNWTKKFLCGTLSLGIAGTFVFGLLGTFTAVLGAYDPLYDVAFDRTRFGNPEYLFWLAIALNNVFWFTFAAFWLLVGGSSLIGGITGFLTPIMLVGKKQDWASQFPWFPAATLPALIILALTIIENLSVFFLLGQGAKNTMDLYGHNPSLDPRWIFQISCGVMWLLFIVLQILYLYWLSQLSVNTRQKRQIAISNILISFISLVFVVSFIFEIDELVPWVIVFVGITAVLAVETAIIGLQLWNQLDNPEYFDPVPWSNIVSWLSVGGISGALISTVSHITTAFFFSVGVISSPLLTELENTNALPPGLPWLEQIVYPLFGSQSIAFGITILLGTLIGLTAAGILFLLPYYYLFRSFSWLWEEFQFVGNEINKYVGGRFPWLWPVCLTLIGVYLLILLIDAPRAGTFLSVIVLTILLSRENTRSYFKNLSWPWVTLAFALSLLELIGAAFINISEPVSRLKIPGEIYLFILLIPCSIMYIGLTVYGKYLSRPLVRSSLLITLSLLLGLLFTFSRITVNVDGGISSFEINGRQENLESVTNSPFNSQSNNQFFTDSHGKVWVGGGNSIFVEQGNTQWQPIQIRDLRQSGYSEMVAADQLSHSFLFAEDVKGRVWIAEGTELYQIEPVLHLPQIPGKLLQPVNNLPSVPQSSSPNLESDPLDNCATGIIQIWTGDGSPIDMLYHHSTNINSLVFSPDAKIIAVNHEGGATELRDLDNHLISTLTKSTEIKFSPDGNRVITFGPPTLWDITGNLLTLTRPENTTSEITYATFSSDGKQIVGYDSQNLYWWDLNGNINAIRAFDRLSYNQVKYSSDGSYILLHTRNQGKLTVLDITTGSEIIIQDKDGNNPVAFDFSPDDTKIIVAWADGTLNMYDRDGNILVNLNNRPLEPDNTIKFKFSPDSRYLLFANNQDNFVHLWSAVDSGGTIRDKDDNNPVAFDFSPDGTKIIVAWADGTLNMYDRDGNEHINLNDKSLQFTSIEVSPGSDLIAAVGCTLKSAYESFKTTESIVDLKSDANGYVWIATDGQGIVRLKSEREVQNSEWESYTSENSNLPSDHINVIMITKDGYIWAGTEKGLSYFDGISWETLANLPNTSITSLLQDRNDQLWIGTTTGGFRWDSKNLVSFAIESENPLTNAEIKDFFEDSLGGVWVATKDSVFRFDNGQFENIDLLVDNITVFTEEPAGVIWLGGRQGLVRYNLAAELGFRELGIGIEDGLKSNWVRDVHATTNGKIWVSTFETTTTTYPSWLPMGLIILLFGFLLTDTYWGHNQHPATLARKLSEQAVLDSGQFYFIVYRILSQSVNASEILVQMSRYLENADDITGAKIVHTLADLTQTSNLYNTLQQNIIALKTDTKRPESGSLSSLYGLLLMALKAERVSDIVFLELSTNSGTDPNRISISWKECHRPIFLPIFLPPGSASAWETLERTSEFLQKSQEVDAARDRLSYLAEALTTMDNVLAAAKTVSQPEGPVFIAIAEQWRTAIAEEISMVSGRAKLRLELRTRQIRRTERITLVLWLQNNGRAAAENITIQLNQDHYEENPSPLVITRLAADRAVSVEFTITPPDRESSRYLFVVTWQDRTSDNHQIEFGDTVHFYETEDEFHVIPNPYVVGHPVKSAEMFHGRGDIFRFIQENLSGPTADRTIVLYGQRRTGKTSILYQLQNGFLSDQFIPVLIDMQELAPIISSTADFLGEIAYHLTRTLNKVGIEVDTPLPEVFDKAPVRTFNRFIDQLESNLGARRLIMMFDEFELIEAKILDKKLDANLLGYFRSLVQHRRGLLFIFTGTHHLEEMSHNYWSILFNIALYQRISFLNTVDAIRLIREPVTGKLDIDELAVEKIINLTHGHPYFLQLVCWALVNHCNKQERNYATINDVNDALHDILVNGESHFAYIWHQANFQEKLALCGLAHTLQSGNLWARPDEILETLADEGEREITKGILIKTLDYLTAQEVLETSQEGVLRYRFQLKILQLWIETTKSVSSLIERRASLGSNQ